MSWGKTTIDPADRAFSRWIRLRDRQCRRCSLRVKFNEKGLPVSCENSHFKSRRYEATRFEPLNCDTLCKPCHKFLGENPEAHERWQRSLKGNMVVDKIILQSHSYKKKDRELEKIYWRQRIAKDFPDVTGY